VPFGKLHTDISTTSNATSENRGHELLSKPPEYYFPKSDLPYFLRGR